MLTGFSGFGIIAFGLCGFILYTTIIQISYGFPLGNSLGTGTSMLYRAKLRVKSGTRYSLPTRGLLMSPLDIPGKIQSRVLVLGTRYLPEACS